MVNPDCLDPYDRPTKLSDWFLNKVVFFKDYQEGKAWFDSHPNGILTKTVDQQPMWLIDGEWVTYPINEKECEK